MSFILDALKKSESDRQRQSGPALFEVKVMPPKPRFPYWALALAALLVINIVIGAWVFLRRPASDPAPAVAAAAAPAAATPAVVAPVAAPAPAPAPAQSLAAVAPPVTAPAAQSPPAIQTASPTSRPEPVLTDSEPRDVSSNPDDYAPAVAAERQDQGMRDPHVRSGTESGLASYADAAANPDLHLPALHIDLHVYAASPQERFVLINMRRVHEGDALPQGGHVESITPEGAIVSFRGTKFFLEHQ